MYLCYCPLASSFSRPVNEPRISEQKGGLVSNIATP